MIFTHFKIVIDGFKLALFTGELKNWKISKKNS